MAYCERTRTTLTILDRPRSTISGTPTKEKDWTLDALGNWPGYVTKTAGSTDLDQTRTNNAVNEITGISETTGTAWIDPAYDAAGNMTTIPKPANLTAGFTATYDAWNRLVKLVDGMNTVAEYEYDGLNQRIVKSIYVSGSLDHREHVYLNEQWQDLEIRKETGGTEDTDPLEQYVWHPYYIDAIVLRDYDPETDGSATRYYSCQDGNSSTTAIIDSSGTVLERYAYTPYGQLIILDADFALDGDGVSDIAMRYAFTGRDLDTESGNYFFRNRLCHNRLGNFLTRDPIDYGDGPNLYRYASSNPIVFLDPLGTIVVRCECSCTVTVSAEYVSPETEFVSINPGDNAGAIPELCGRACEARSRRRLSCRLSDWKIPGSSPDISAPFPSYGTYLSNPSKMVSVPRTASWRGGYS